MNATLIGLGNIGLNYDVNDAHCIQTHAKALAVYGFNVLCVELNKAQQDLAKQRYGFASVASIHDVPDTYQAELIIIASPTELHREHIEWALARKPTVLLIEKPIAQTLAELDVLTTPMHQADTVVMINLIRNYDDLTLQLLMQQRTGCDVVVEYSQSLLHNGIHFLALLMKVFGPIVDTVIKQVDAEKPIVQWQFAHCVATFQPEPSGKDNRLFVRSPSAEYAFLNGGRDINMVRDGLPLTLSNRLAHYQENVMKAVLKVMAGQDDDSLQLAEDAQRAIHSVISEDSQ